MPTAPASDLDLSNTYLSPAASHRDHLQHKTKLARDANNKIMGKITKKHVTIRRANEVFGSYFKEPLRKRDEDLCDSLIISYAYHLRRLRGLYA